MHDMEHYGNLVTYMRMKKHCSPIHRTGPGSPAEKNNRWVTDGPAERAPSLRFWSTQAGLWRRKVTERSLCSLAGLKPGQTSRSEHQNSPPLRGPKSARMGHAQPSHPSPSDYFSAGLPGLFCGWGNNVLHPHVGDEVAVVFHVMHVV